MADTTAVLEGNLTRDPEIRYPSGGRAVANFGVAVNTQFERADGSKDERVDFYDVECWGAQAENLGASMHKGNRVLVVGRLKVDTWETDDGQKRSKVKVVANAVAASLRFGTATAGAAAGKADAAEGSSDGGGQPYDEEPF